MALTYLDALAAYRAVSQSTGPGMDARDGRDGASFAELLKGAAGDAIATAQKSEQIVAAAIDGKADVAEVVIAVANAELTLQTVVTIRDRVVQAYQEILRMPI